VKAARFAYLRPDSLAEALEALARYGDDARILAGGQSLGAMLNMRIVTPGALIDINRLDGLDRIETTAATVTTPALVRQSDALVDADVRRHVPLLAAVLPHVGHVQTRSRGTLCGSVAHADPSAEVPLALTTLGGTIELRSKRGARKVAADAFWRGALSTAREPGECIVALHWPRADSASTYGFSEFAIRDGDFAIVAVACFIDRRGGPARIRLGFGGCGDFPQTVDLAGEVSASSAADLAHAAAKAIECRGDPFATAAYRRQLAFTLARGLLKKQVTKPEATHA
jgi:2-furoyl-CoA dehydrogenase FAD binding subunit